MKKLTSLTLISLLGLFTICISCKKENTNLVEAQEMFNSENHNNTLKSISEAELFAQHHNQILDSICYSMEFPYDNSEILFEKVIDLYQNVTGEEVIQDFTFENFGFLLNSSISYNAVKNLANTEYSDENITEIERDYVILIDSTLKLSTITNVEPNLLAVIEDIINEDIENIDEEKKDYLIQLVYVGIYSFTYWHTVFSDENNPWTVHFQVDENNIEAASMPRWMDDVFGYVHGLYYGLDNGFELVDAHRIGKLIATSRSSNH